MLKADHNNFIMKNLNKHCGYFSGSDKCWRPFPQNGIVEAKDNESIDARKIKLRRGWRCWQKIKMWKICTFRGYNSLSMGQYPQNDTSEP